MTVSTLKNNIYQLLDRIENTEMLEEINYILADYVQNFIENPAHTLSDYEKNKIQTGLEELEKGNEVSHPEIQQLIASWRKK